VGVSAIVFHELYYGAFRSGRAARNVDIVDALRFAVLPFEKEDARRAGQIRAQLAAKGTPVGPFDVLIAGHAAARGLILVTYNRRKFARVSGFSIEDWQE
jgi:tRNA(fMet)-specific endonuclease VapC